MIPFSVLDLSPIVAGGDAALAFAQTRQLAQHAERLGYHRYWLAEHHNMPGIASAATALVIGHVAAATSHIRVGAGGIMLPNHAPLVIAEQFGTLASMHPGRIDLGIGRAPGTDHATARALRRHLDRSVDTFPDDVRELQGYFESVTPPPHVRAIPGFGLNVPIWLLGSSHYSARLAGSLGLPFAFASHFSPDAIDEALTLYRHAFAKSEAGKKPHVMLAVHTFLADSATDAERAFSSLLIQFVNVRRGTPGPLPAPVDDLLAHGSADEYADVRRVLRFAFVGTRESVRGELGSFLGRYAPDELIVTSHGFDLGARLRSLELVAAVRDDLNA